MGHPSKASQKSCWCLIIMLVNVQNRFENSASHSCVRMWIRHFLLFTLYIMHDIHSPYVLQYKPVSLLETTIAFTRSPGYMRFIGDCVTTRDCDSIRDNTVDYYYMVCISFPLECNYWVFEMSFACYIYVNKPSPAFATSCSDRLWLYYT